MCQMSLFIPLSHAPGASSHLAYTTSTSCSIILSVQEILSPLSVFVVVLGASAGGGEAESGGYQRMYVQEKVLAHQAR
jgi:hypothetical protein